MIAEGVFTAQSVFEKSTVMGVATPICTEVYRVIYEGKSPREAVIALMQREAVPLLLVNELMRQDIPLVRNTDDLAAVLAIFSRFDVDYLPVCLAQSPGKVIGLIGRAGLMRYYQTRLAG